MRLSKQAVASIVAAGTLLGASLAAVGADAFHDRHMAMEAVGDAMKTLGAIAKKEAPFDAAVVKKSAGTIADNLKKAATLFPAGSGGGESRAKPEVWTDAAGFAKAMKDGHAAAVALQAVSDEAAYRPALGALGASCKGCHDKYRMAKE